MYANHIVSEDKLLDLSHSTLHYYHTLFVAFNFNCTGFVEKQVKACYRGKEFNNKIT